MACTVCKNVLYKISFLKPHLRYNQVKMIAVTRRPLSTTSDEPIDVPQKEKISKAMKAYLERARQYDQFLKQEAVEFNIGKKHLANIMGEDAETFTQQDIDKAIQYLLPSGLFDPKARPLMKPPEEIFPRRKAAEFDETGRPHHYMFYTTRPNFNELLKNCVDQIKALNEFEDRMLRKNLQPEPGKALSLSGSNWITQAALESIVLEPLVEVEYNKFIEVMDRLASHPYGFRVKDFIMTYRNQLVKQTRKENIPEPQVLPDGRCSVSEKCYRKSSHGTVTVISPGSGKININGKDIDYFDEIQHREQVLENRVVSVDYL